MRFRLPLRRAAISSCWIAFSAGWAFRPTFYRSLCGGPASILSILQPINRSGQEAAPFPVVGAWEPGRIGGLSGSGRRHCSLWRGVEALSLNGFTGRSRRSCAACTARPGKPVREGRVDVDPALGPPARSLDAHTQALAKREVAGELLPGVALPMQSGGRPKPRRYSFGFEWRPVARNPSAVLVAESIRSASWMALSTQRPCIRAGPTRGLNWRSAWLRRAALKRIHPVWLGISGALILPHQSCFGEDASGHLAPHPRSLSKKKASPKGGIAETGCHRRVQPRIFP